MTETELEIQKKISNAIWTAIKPYAESGQTFEWEVTFTDKDGNTVQLGE